jgi:hypothetical protein
MSASASSAQDARIRPLFTRIFATPRTISIADIEAVVTAEDRHYLDVTPMRPQGSPILNHFVFLDREDIVRFLLHDLHLYVDAKDWSGNSSLFDALLQNTSILKMLLRAGANVNLRNNIGDTALMNAIRFPSDDSDFIDRFKWFIGLQNIDWLLTYDHFGGRFAAFQIAYNMRHLHPVDGKLFDIMNEYLISDTFQRNHIPVQSSTNPADYDEVSIPKRPSKFQHIDLIESISDLSDDDSDSNAPVALRPEGKAAGATSAATTARIRAINKAAGGTAALAGTATFRVTDRAPGATASLAGASKGSATAAGARAGREVGVAKIGARHKSVSTTAGAGKQAGSATGEVDAREKACGTSLKAPSAGKSAASSAVGTESKKSGRKREEHERESSAIGRFNFDLSTSDLSSSEDESSYPASSSRKRHHYQGRQAPTTNDVIDLTALSDGGRYRRHYLGHFPTWY